MSEEPPVVFDQAASGLLFAGLSTMHQGVAVATVAYSRLTARTTTTKRLFSLRIGSSPGLPVSLGRQESSSRTSRESEVRQAHACRTCSFRSIASKLPLATSFQRNEGAQEFSCRDIVEGSRSSARAQEGPVPSSDSHPVRPSRSVKRHLHRRDGTCCSDTRDAPSRYDLP